MTTTAAPLPADTQIDRKIVAARVVHDALVQNDAVIREGIVTALAIELEGARAALRAFQTDPAPDPEGAIACGIELGQRAGRVEGYHAAIRTVERMFAVVREGRDAARDAIR